MEHLRLGQEDGGVPDVVPQHPRANVEQDPRAEQ